MLFNRWVEIGARYDYSGDTELRPTDETVPLNQTVQALRQQAGKPVRSVIDAWLTITGNLESEGDILVDGKVQGRIRCSHIIVGKDAAIDGDIVASEVLVRGKVKGVIRANRVKLQGTACVESEIFFDKSLGIEDGASFEGQIRRASEPSLALDVPIEPPAATGQTGPAANLSSSPGEPDTRIVSKSQPRRDRQSGAHATNSE